MEDGDWHEDDSEPEDDPLDLHTLPEQPYEAPSSQVEHSLDPDDLEDDGQSLLIAAVEPSEAGQGEVPDDNIDLQAYGLEGLT